MPKNKIDLTNFEDMKVRRELIEFINIYFKYQMFDDYHDADELHKNIQNLTETLRSVFKTLDFDQFPYLIVFCTSDYALRDRIKTICKDLGLTKNDYRIRKIASFIPHGRYRAAPSTNNFIMCIGDTTNINLINLMAHHNAKINPILDLREIYPICKLVVDRKLSSLVEMDSTTGSIKFNEELSYVLKLNKNYLFERFQCYVT